MALIVCVECEKQFSDRAAACPDCACPVEESRTLPEVNKRPDKRIAKEKLLKATKLCNSFTNIANSYNSEIIAVEKAVDGFAHYSVLQEMATLDIEKLNTNKQGIRTTVLRNAGFANIAQLHGLSVSQITRINGIGEQTAKKIKRIVNGIFNTLTESTEVHINLKNKTQYQDELIKALFVLRNNVPIRRDAENLVKSEPGFKNALAKAKPVTSSIRWFFSFKSTKEEAVKAYSYISELMNSSFSSIAERHIENYNNIVNVDIGSATRDFEKNAVAYYTLLENLGLSTSKTSATDLPEDLVAEIEQYPLNLTHMKTELRKYQIFGSKYILHQRMALLGDEMGLGKTIQALAVIADMNTRSETHALVVCPASVLVNWKRETEKHTELCSNIIHGVDKIEEFELWKSEGGIGITNFETVVKLIDVLDFNFGTLVVDEAHFVKNPEAIRTKALIALSKKAKQILYMTGTPLENRVDEMCFLIKCLRPDIAKKLSTIKTLSATQKFKGELAPVYLRRVRDDVLVELPDLIESEDWLEPTNKELNAYYNTVLSGNFMAMRRVSWDVDTSKSSKAMRLLEICNEARDENRKVIVFSFFRDTLQKVCELLGERALGPITGSVSTTMRQTLVDDFSQAEDGKVLVAQVQAGGVGLNIQSASVIIFCEPQIKPSLENQAISRAYRMGQVRDVQVHRLLCIDTIDEPMMEMLGSKQKEFNTYAEESIVGMESLERELDSKFVKEMIAQEKARINELQNHL